MKRPQVPAIVLSSGLNGLGAVRSLGAAGVPVWSIVERSGNLSVRSRHSRNFLRKPDENAIDAVLRLSEVHQVDQAVVLATSDQDALVIAEDRSRLPGGIVVAGPRREVVLSLVDKRDEIEVLGASGVSLPPSVARPDLDPPGLLARLRLPVIIKPRRQALADRLGFKNKVLRTAAELSDFLKDYAGRLDLFVAQEVVPGGDDETWVCNAVFNSAGSMVAGNTFQRLGMSPPHFGATTFAVSRINDRILEESSRIAGALGYTGPGMMEFKFDSRDGLLKYIETNPRLGMCNWFDTRCGVNNAHRAYTLALGDETTVVARQTEGLFYIDFIGDLSSRLSDEDESPGSMIASYGRLVRGRWVSPQVVGGDLAPSLALIARQSGRLSARAARHASRTVSGRARLVTKNAVTAIMASRAGRPVLKRMMRGRVPVFMLHRLRGVTRRDSGHDPLQVTEALDALRRHGVRFVSLEEVAAAAREGRSGSQPAAAFSIDDGYADQVELAGHLLALDVPVTLFVITDLIDGKDWPWDAKVAYCVRRSRFNELRFSFQEQVSVLPAWTPEQRVMASFQLQDHGKRLPSHLLPEFVAAVALCTEVDLPTTPPDPYRAATWDELRALAARGAAIAPHSCSHRVMSSLTDDEARREIEASWNRVSSEIPGVAKLIAWPTGRYCDFTRRDCEYAASMGFLSAFATNEGYAEIGAADGLGRYALNRFSLPHLTEDVIQCALGIEQMKRKILFRN